MGPSFSDSAFVRASLSSVIVMMPLLEVVEIAGLSVPSWLLTSRLDADYYIYCQIVARIPDTDLS